MDAKGFFFLHLLECVPEVNVEIVVVARRCRLDHWRTALPLQEVKVGQASVHVVEELLVLVYVALGWREKEGLKIRIRYS